jgi:hypothetical protein
MPDDSPEFKFMRSETKLLKVADNMLQIGFVVGIISRLCSGKMAIAVTIDGVKR